MHLLSFCRLSLDLPNCRINRAVALKKPLAVISPPWNWLRSWPKRCSIFTSERPWASRQGSQPCSLLAQIEMTPCATPWRLPRVWPAMTSLWRGNRISPALLAATRCHKSVTMQPSRASWHRSSKVKLPWSAGASSFFSILKCLYIDTLCCVLTSQESRRKMMKNQDKISLHKHRKTL